VRADRAAEAMCALLAAMGLFLVLFASGARELVMDSFI
jgi:hypothetical protein